MSDGDVLESERREILATVREFVERDVKPNVEQYERADEFPAPMVEAMRELGLFGVTIPEEHGGLGLDLTTYTLIQVELSRAGCRSRACSTPISSRRG